MPTVRRICCRVALVSGTEMLGLPAVEFAAVGSRQHGHVNAVCPLPGSQQEKSDQHSNGSPARLLAAGSQRQRACAAPGVFNQYKQVAVEELHLYGKHPGHAEALQRFADCREAGHTHEDERGAEGEHCTHDNRRTGNPSGGDPSLRAGAGWTLRLSRNPIRKASNSVIKPPTIPATLLPSRLSTLASMATCPPARLALPASSFGKA